MRTSHPAMLGAAAACLAVPLLAPTATATNDELGEYQVADLETVAGGLPAPRGLTTAKNGDVYVALSGKGADDATDPVCADTEELGPRCFGNTGAIAKLDVSGRSGHHHELSLVATALPSLAGPDDSNPIGPTDVSLDERGRLFATIGLGANPEHVLEGGAFDEADEHDLLASVVSVNPRTGHVARVAGIAEFEADNDPDGRGPDTNPYSLVAGREGHVVADAGGDSLLGVTGTGIETLHVFPQEATPAGFPPELHPEPVPSAVVKGPDGAYYIGQLTGGPFVPGTATIWRMEPGREPEVYADGFTNIIDLAFTENGDLLVLELAHNGLASGDPTGALIVVPKAPDGITAEKHMLSAMYPLDIPGLVLPGGVAVDGDTVYVTNQTVSPKDGELLRFTLTK